MGIIWSWIEELFWEQQMEIAIVGLQSAGKSSFVRVISQGDFHDDLLPTIGIEMHKISKNDIQIKLWDLGGQARFRPMWEHYCKGVQVIVFVVDSADNRCFEQARKELQDLICLPSLNHIPLLVLSNKNDLPASVDSQSMSQILQLHTIKDREVSIYSISCKNKNNLETTLKWLVKHAKAGSSNDL